MESLADTFFWIKNYQTNVKCYVERVFKSFFDTQKMFFSVHFFGKKIQKQILKNFSPLKNFANFFRICFFKKVS